ncbi:hypothetical protein Lser_V15G10003 [Lactuca serriola]
MCFSYLLKLAVCLVALLIQTNEVVSEDHLALLAIKSKITDDSQGFLISWNDSLPFCEWRGVTSGRRHQRVTSLNISNWGLVGTLSPYVGNLSFLRYIMFANNQLHGGIPPEIGRLHRLRVLSLANNSFTEEIPANISSCSKLWYLDLSFNMLSGKIPNVFSSLGMIKALGFGKNNLTGGIPASIGNLTSLEQLSLSYCPLGGSIPDSFNQLKNLRKLGLGEMGLVGVFPSFLFNLSKLQLLNFPENQLVGRLPSNLCVSQPHLQRLEFSYNHFNGHLPSSISNCSELRSFDVLSNNFKGEVAADFGKLRYLRWLTLGGSGTNVGLGGMKHFDSLSNCSDLEVLQIVEVQIRRVLPDSLGNLTKLRYLMIESSYISGTLPSSIGNLFSLILLSLPENNFTGMIPKSIGNLGNVGELDLDANSFSGIIPRSIGNMSSVTKITLSRNKLEGAIPSTIGACKRLLLLSLDGNNLRGSIPKELFQLSSLSVGLDLSQNNLSGVLPQEIEHLKNLGILYLSENHLSGELPGSLSSCISLQVLDLSSNFFHGSMPERLSSLKGLEYVNLSRNNFSGHVPAYLQQIALKYLDVSYNDFEGEVYVKGVFANASAISVIGNHRLCGGIPELHLPNCTNISNYYQKSKKLSLGVILAISVPSSVVASLALVSFLLLYFCKKKTSESVVTESFDKISYERLFKATQGFSLENLIGTGSFGSVYRGVVDEDEHGIGPTVAIKVINLQRRGSSKSFVAECEALRNIRHRNLVKVITICSSLDFHGNDFKALIYDFMPNGSLESWLHPHDHQLDLSQRISIAKDVAYALDYLHYHCGNTVVHCDLKPSNILLDADMVAHVGDFGLAKILSLEQLSNPHKTSSSSIMRGTIGYAPPEYGVGNEVSTSGDMYSYGILMLEMLTGKKPVDPIFEQGLNLHSYARKALADGFVLQIVDPMLLNDDVIVNQACLISLVKIGVQCSSESPQNRLHIGTVIHELHALFNA